MVNIVKVCKYEEKKEEKKEEKENIKNNNDVTKKYISVHVSYFDPKNEFLLCLTFFFFVNHYFVINHHLLTHHNPISNM